VKWKGCENLRRCEPLPNFEAGYIRLAKGKTLRLLFFSRTGHSLLSFANCDKTVAWRLFGASVRVIL
jgi:hypothetical protein